MITALSKVWPLRRNMLPKKSQIGAYFTVTRVKIACLWWWISTFAPVPTSTFHFQSPLLSKKRCWTQRVKTRTFASTPFFEEPIHIRWHRFRLIIGRSFTIIILCKVVFSLRVHTLNSEEFWSSIIVGYGHCLLCSVVTVTWSIVSIQSHNIGGSIS